MEETVHADTGLAGFTTKYLYFSEEKKKFRARCDCNGESSDVDPQLGVPGFLRQLARTGIGANQTGMGLPITIPLLGGLV